ncbi:hypothetical protein JKF63_06678 [Porcisia hertigi]|uniref:Uncharacterized protein n=1 Tax=Porcisia hertigi TaxID=2761500 RepID=A0A836IZC6_9TRYP|nr:hypothetical protein JKF63_06678 [Porcisia hertigi]
MGTPPVARLIAEEEQAARPHAYNKRVRGRGEGVGDETCRYIVALALRQRGGADLVRCGARQCEGLSKRGGEHDRCQCPATLATQSTSCLTLWLRLIPSAVMSEDVKQLLFTDFSNAFRSFFHTNVLSMPFVFCQTGSGGGVLLLTVVAVTSAYATAVYFGAKKSHEGMPTRLSCTAMCRSWSGATGTRRFTSSTV